MAESATNQPTLGEVEDLVRRFSRLGKPEKGTKLRHLFNAGEPIPSELLDPEGKVKSEKPVFDALPLPPRSGRGSGHEKWMEFALKVSDFDKAVLKKLNRDEVVELLEDRGIIERIEEDDSEEE